MGNKHPKDSAAKAKKEKPVQDTDEVKVQEESVPFYTLEVIFEMKSGSQTSPEEHLVDPNITLKEWKEDLKQSRGIQTAVAVRRDNRNDDLQPDHLSLNALQIENREVLRFRECS